MEEVCARQFMCRTKRQRGSASDISMHGWLVLVDGYVVVCDLGRVE